VSATGTDKSRGDAAPRVNSRRAIARSTRVAANMRVAPARAPARVVARDARRARRTKARRALERGRSESGFDARATRRATIGDDAARARVEDAMRAARATRASRWLDAWNARDGSSATTRGTRTRASDARTTSVRNEDVEAMEGEDASAVVVDDGANGDAGASEASTSESVDEDAEGREAKKSTADRGLGQRRALSAETRSRPFVPLKGEVLHIAWYREYDETGKFTREEGLAYRECIEQLLAHYTMPKELVEETLDGIERGWSDVTLNLGSGFNLRMQRHTEFETITLSGPGNMKASLGTRITPWQWLLPHDWLADIPGKVFLVNHAVFRQLSQPSRSEEPTLKELNAIRKALGSTLYEDKVNASMDEEDAVLEWDAGSLVGCGIGDGSRMFANYELDDSGAMTTLVVVPPGDSTFIRAGRQLQRFFALEQYRLMILQRLPMAKSKFPLLAGLNERYEMLSRELRRSKATARGHKDQQEFVTQITELEQAITQLVTRTKLVALTTASYLEIIELRLAEASFTRLGYEIRFLPLFVKKRIDPAVSTIYAVAEQAKILSDALERTTSLVQASVEVRLQRINERIATYGLLFTIVSVLVSFTTSIQPNGSLHWLFVLVKAKFFSCVAFGAKLCASGP
jgi:uncharacterized membrane-anchored protein|tara:strand:+ start:3257 stop:5161 length:1905 start_codon:yes stop_codon:yes gene_type:complete